MIAQTRYLLSCLFGSAVVNLSVSYDTARLFFFVLCRVGALTGCAYACVCRCCRPCSGCRFSSSLFACGRDFLFCVAFVRSCFFFFVCCSVCRVSRSAITARKLQVSFSLC